MSLLHIKGVFLFWKEGLLPHCCRQRTPYLIVIAPGVLCVQLRSNFVGTEFVAFDDGVAPDTKPPPEDRSRLRQVRDHSFLSSPPAPSSCYALGTVGDSRRQLCQ